MDTKKQKEQEEKLKELSKRDLPAKVKESVKDRLKNIDKPVCK